MSCNRVNINRKSIVCAGDLRYPITIHVRTIIPPTDVDFDLSLENQKIVKAGVNITSSINDVDGTNTSNIETHSFYIRYDEFATNAYLIEFNNKYYNVTSIKDVDFQQKFLILNATERGTTSNKVNIV